VIKSFRIAVASDTHDQIFPIFETSFGGKRVFTACGTGHIEDGQPQLSPATDRIFAVLWDYAQHEQLGKFHFMEIGDAATAAERVRHALESANDKEVVLFLCRDMHVLDAGFEALGVYDGPERTLH